MARKRKAKSTNPLRPFYISWHKVTERGKNQDIDPFNKVFPERWLTTVARSPKQAKRFIARRICKAYGYNDLFIDWDQIEPGPPPVGTFKEKPASKFVGPAQTTLLDDPAFYVPQDF